MITLIHTLSLNSSVPITQDIYILFDFIAIF